MAYRRDALGFVDEGLNFAVSGEVKPSSIPSNAEVWGELFIDRAGGTNFKFHVEKGIGFPRARKCLERFVSIIQQRIDTAEKCPHFERHESPENILHIAACQAVTLLNQSVNDNEQEQARTILRQALVDYADAKE